MNRFGSLVLVGVALCAAVIGLYVSAANRDLVAVDLLFFPAVSIRVGLALVLAFVAGGVVGMVIAGVSASARARTGQWKSMREGRAPR